MKLSPYRNNANLLWIKRGALALKKSITELLRIDGWTSSEIKFLKRIGAMVDIDVKGTVIIRITMEQANELLELSVGAMVDREQIVKDDLLMKEDAKNFKEVLFLLEANERLLKLIGKKLKNLEIDSNDLVNVRDISNSLMKSYLFLLGEIEESYLKESLTSMREIWRHYNSIEEIVMI